ncbi:MAG: bactofilin family protein [Alkalispirochaetaceae bacterium]
MSQPFDDALVNSIVGHGTHFRGHLELSGLLRIDGDFSGSIKTGGKVIIGRGGRADCSIDAHTVVIGGVVRGNVYASDKVIALESAIIIGNIYAARLIAEDGVLIDAGLMISGPQKREAKPSSPARQEEPGRARRAPWSRRAREGALRGSDRA